MPRSPWLWNILFAGTAKCNVIKRRNWQMRKFSVGPRDLNMCRQQFLDLVRVIVQRLQSFCPQLGKVKLAQVLARVGLHLGATTVGRMSQDAG
jgi:hypothetical protein